MSGPSDFALDVRVYYEDTDSAGIVYYANYLHFFERARTEWLRALGFEHARLREAHGIVFTVARIEVDYLVPARLDDLLVVDARLADARRASFFIEQSITRRPATTALCRARVRVACVDAERLKPAAIPRDVITELSREHRPVTH